MPRALILGGTGLIGRAVAMRLVDCICYSAADARLLLPLSRNATSTVVISSKAVYVDAHGNHSNSDVPPRFEEPVRENG